MNTKTKPTPTIVTGILLSAAFLAFIFVPMKAEAVLLAYESFDYTPGTYSNLASTESPGYYGPFVANNDDLEIVSTSLTSGASPFASAAGAFTNTNSGNAFAWDNYRMSLNSPIGATDTTTIYMSYLVRRDQIIDNTFRLSLGDGQRLGTGIRNNSGSQSFFAEANGVIDNSSKAATLGDTYFIVAKLEFGNGTDTVSMTSFASGDTVPIMEPVTWDASATANVGGPVNVVRLDVYDSVANAITLDEWRIGTTWDSVAVPEPSSMILLMTGLGILMGRRSRMGKNK